jgi:hypothetical protein
MSGEYHHTYRVLFLPSTFFLLPVSASTVEAAFVGAWDSPAGAVSAAAMQSSKRDCPSSSPPPPFPFLPTSSVPLPTAALAAGRSRFITARPCSRAPSWARLAAVPDGCRINEEVLCCCSPSCCLCLPFFGCSGAAGNALLTHPRLALAQSSPVRSRRAGFSGLPTIQCGASSIHVDDDWPALVAAILLCSPSAADAACSVPPAPAPDRPRGWTLGPARSGSMSSCFFSAA